jgi:hypothetical protein
MLVPRQQYPRELKIATMRELDSGKSVGEALRTTGRLRSTLLNIGADDEHQHHPPRPRR